MDAGMCLHLLLGTQHVNLLAHLPVVPFGGKYFPNWVNLCRSEHCLGSFWDRLKGLDTLVAEAVAARKMSPAPYHTQRSGPSREVGLSRHCSSFMPDVSFLPRRVRMSPVTPCDPWLCCGQSLWVGG